MTSYTSTTGDTWEQLKRDESAIRVELILAQERLRTAVQASLDLSCRLTAWQEEQKSHE